MNQSTVVLALNQVSTRTYWLSTAIGGQLLLIKSRPPYLGLLPRLVAILVRNRSRRVVVQLPVGPLLLGVLLTRIFCKRFTLLADVHTGFLMAGLNFSKHGALNAPFIGMLRHVDRIILQNEANLSLLPRGLSRKALILYDPFYALHGSIRMKSSSSTMTTRDYALFPASWHPDEPIEFLIRTWVDAGIPFPLLITGKPRGPLFKKVSSMLEDAPNVKLTGYLDYDDYLDMAAGSKLIISATTSEMDAQCSAYEALALGKPILATSTSVLRAILDGGAVYFDLADPSTLVSALNLVLTNYDACRSAAIGRAVSLEKKTRTSISAEFEIPATGHAGLPAAT